MLLTELKSEIREILKIIKNLNLQFNRHRLDKIWVKLRLTLRVLRTSAKRTHTCSSIRTRQIWCRTRLHTNTLTTVSRRTPSHTRPASTHTAWSSSTDSHLPTASSPSRSNVHRWTEMLGHQHDSRSKGFSRDAMASRSPCRARRVTWLHRTTRIRSRPSRSTLPLWCPTTTTTHRTCKGHPRPSSLDNLDLTATTEWTHSKTVKMRTLRWLMSSSTNATT